MRKPIIAGNWKMYKNVQETCAFFEKFLPLVSGSNHCDIVVCPSFVNLKPAVDHTAGSNVHIGGQNLFWAKEGAYTGEISAGMLTAVGCRWVLIGHSERRQFFDETDEKVAKKIGPALEAGLTPIVCVGEMLAEREAGQTHAVLERQFKQGIAPIGAEQFGKIVIAYEPVWAIGTGKTATPEIASEAHGVIRGLVKESFGETAAASCRILYGGSVKPDNVKKLMAEDDIDGALVGGASLDPVSFASLVNY